MKTEDVLTNVAETKGGLDKTLARAGVASVSDELDECHLPKGPEHPPMSLVQLKVSADGTVS